MAECECDQPHVPRRVVLTGGPGAGKTAVLELVRRSLCRHVRILPESAGSFSVAGSHATTTRSVDARRNGRSSTFRRNSRRPGTLTIRQSCCATAARSTGSRTGRATG